MCTGTQPSSVAEALAAVRDGLAFLNTVETASIPVGQQAECLRELARAESAHTSAQARVLGAVSSQGGHADDGQHSARAWLKWQTQVTSGAAAGAVGWMRRLAAHPEIASALADGSMSTSWARQICAWTDLLPPGQQAEADKILLAAAAGGATLADLAGLAEEMRRRSAAPDHDGDGAFDDRNLRLGVTFRGAGRLDGHLTAGCTAALAAVLEALGKKAGPEDDRTAAQRRHDALEEACRRLIGAGGLPDVAGQPTQIQLHMSVDQLRSTGGAADAESAWAAGRAAGDGTPGWAPDPATVHAYACDAQITPVVAGHVDRVALAAMTRAFLAAQHRAGAPVDMADLQDILLRYAADVLSGPAGLAAALRTGLPGPQAAAVSLPLDVGSAVRTVPPHLRRAVIARDRRCAFPGCHQPPAACQVHHLIPRSRGGPTALGNLALACSFHHLIAIHRWGWTLNLNGDGTTTAVSPDRAKVLHSHSPPTVAAA